MTPSITFFVAGDPKGQPRPRAFARQFGAKWQARMYDAGTADGWKCQIGVAWKEHKPSDFTTFTGPVALDIVFHIARPKSHYLKAGLRENAPQHCAKKPDADNYAKAVMDALTVLGVWVDDSQVCFLRVGKLFCNNTTPGAMIEIRELAP